jgi:hypothetical protein
LSLGAINPSSAQGGSIAVSGTNLTYSPGANFSGNDTFGYTVNDARGASVTGQVAVYVSGNTAPILNGVPDMLANVLVVLTFTNVAVDTDVPANGLFHTLEGSGPTNAHINASDGVFHWRPSREYAHTTNIFTVRVTDDGVPPLSRATNFTVYVNDYIEATVGSVVMQAGETNTVPVDLFASAAFASARCAIQFDSQRVANVGLDVLAPQLASVAMEMADSNTVSLTFTAALGQTLQGTQHLARLRFTAVPGQASAFTPFHIVSLDGTNAAAGSFAPGTIRNDGRAVIVGAQPMLESLPPVSGQRAVMLYGRKGSSYSIYYSTNLAGTSTWTLRGPVSLTTNIFRSVTVGNNPAPPVFYEVRP